MPHLLHLFTLFLFICSLDRAACEVYHITTNVTATELCVVPCLTFSQFAANISYYLNQNHTMLVFLPGTHYLDANLTVSDFDKFSMMSQNLTVQILCTNHSHFFLNNCSQYVHITNVEFIGCGGNQVENTKEFVLQDVKFIGQEHSGTVLELVDTAAEIVNCTFASNRKGKVRCIRSVNSERSCIFNDLIHVGGAIIATRSEINISQSSFENSKVEGGAALFAERQSIINVKNSTFIKNRGAFYAVVYSSESTIRIEASKFDGNSGSVNGGVVYSKNSHITIAESQFQSNSGGLSGAVLVSDSSHINIEGSEFYNNTATWGGAFYFKTSNVTIEASKLDDNRAYLGGVMYSVASNITIETSKFENNTAINSRSGPGRGGVLHSERSTIMIKASQFENNTAHDEGGILHSARSNITIEASNFDSNKAVYRYGGVVYCYQSTITINGSEFENNRAIFKGGGVLYSYGSTIMVIASNFSRSNATTIGGVLYSSSSTITIQESEFDANKATNGAVLHISIGTIMIHASSFYDNFGYSGGVLSSASCNVTIEVSAFYNNSAANGGVLYSDESTIRISNGEFDDNIAMSGIVYSKSSTIHVEMSKFDKNYASLYGGVLYSERSNISFNKSKLIGNVSPIGVIFYATENSLIGYSSLLVTNNSATNYALIYLTDSKFDGHVHTLGNTTFSYNLGSLVAFNSNITLKSNTKFVHTKPPQSTMDTFQEGGVITLFQSNAYFDGACNFEHNIAENGGAILSSESKIYVNGNIKIAHNTASRNGGGIYLSNSELNCHQRSTMVLLSNTAMHKGGGIHTISSSIKVTSSVVSKRWYRKEYTGSRLNFHENKAEKGGGLSLEANAKLYILKYDSITVSEFGNNMYDTNTTIFTGNSANYGGAVYVDDETNSGTCSSNPKTECFFQVLAVHSIRDDLKMQSIQFSQNSASISGATLYGGLLDRCAVSQFAEIRNKFTKHTFEDGGHGITYFKNISISIYYNITEFNFVLLPNGGLATGKHKYTEVLITNVSISSHPVGVCLCINDVHDCTQQKLIAIKKGEVFSLTLVAVDQVGEPVNATIQSSLKFTESGLAEGQLTREIPAECTDLRFNIVSPHNFENLTLYASDGPCKDTELSTKTIEIHFLPCSCPIGLQISGMNEINCTCECHSDIGPYVAECDSQTGSFVRESKSRAWISYVKNTTVTGYLVYPNCPFDYCSSSNQLRIDLNQPNGSDAQCAFSRLFLLCGSCQPGLSLSLGSSRCLLCPSYWPALLIVITIAAILAGIALVIFLLILNMTVAVGTLNGLIFYANIVYANKSILLPFQGTSFVTVFVSLLNLELGIDTCYIQSMDTYAKIWLQLVFPIYVIFLVVLVIIISSHSIKFSNLIGRKNPVATLSTLILLSYAKLLGVCFKSLSVGILEYPDGSREWLWLPDATVKYLSGKHVPLYITSVLILLIGLLYTALIFSWQWLLLLPNWRIFRWTRDPKMQIFVETYHTPFTPKHRYWIGLLLIIRIILYLVAAINVSNDPTLSLTAIVFSVCFLLGLKGFIGSRLYRKWSVDVLETMFYLNIILFAIFTWYSLTNTGSNQVAAAYISVTITIIVLLLVILYHTYSFTTVFSNLKKTRFGRILNELFTETNSKPNHERHPSLPPDDDIHRFNELLDIIDRPINTNDYTLPLGQNTVQPTSSEVVVHKPNLAPSDPEKGTQADINKTSEA